MTQTPPQPEAATSVEKDASAAPAGRSVFLETFGCQMNVLDSQLVRGQLLGLGYRFIDDWKKADVVLYNTCSVREHAEQKVWSRIGLVGKHKQHHPHKVLGVIGCMAEREGKDLIRKYPQVDLLCGPGELDKVPLLIDNVVKTQGSWGAAPPPPSRKASDDLVALQGNTHRRSSTLAAAEDQLEMLDLARSFSPDEHTGSAYVRITRGCNKFCTYCVVPNTRGREVHRSPDNIIDECKRLVDAGVIEITLLGQTVNHYHYDHGAAVTLGGVQQPQVGAAVTGPMGEARDSERAAAVRPRATGKNITTFAELLHRIHEEVPALQRLRFVTSFPRDFGDDILEVIRDSPRMCRYLHLPVQSGSDRMLKMMNRGYEVAEFVDLMHRTRAYLPDVTIASDLICGFPTETEDDHQKTKDLLRDAVFKNCFVFKYSPRPGTAAYDKLKDDVSDEDKRRRNNELLAIQAENSAKVHEAFVGKTVPVFIESISQKSMKEAQHGNITLGWEQPREITQLAGRTSGDLITMVEADPSLVGSIVDVHIEHAAPLTLFGKLVEASTADAHGQ